MAEALVAFGGNVGDARSTIARAIVSFCRRPSVQLQARSSDYLTPPWGVTDQSPFINACIAVTTDLTPETLLAHARQVETEFGRDRDNERRWGPRPIDIDLLAYDNVTMATPTLTLPHPRLFERAFVLVPLSEIAPDRLIGGRRMIEALERLDRSGIERLP